MSAQALTFLTRRFRRPISGNAMRKRFEEFALSLHPEKTRLIEFGRQAANRRERSGLGRPETFNFLGFTHICGRSPSWQVPPQEEIPAGPHAG